MICLGFMSKMKKGDFKGGVLKVSECQTVLMSLPGGFCGLGVLNEKRALRLAC